MHVRLGRGELTAQRGDEKAEFPIGGYLQPQSGNGWRIVLWLGPGSWEMSWSEIEVVAVAGSSSFERAGWTEPPPLGFRFPLSLCRAGNGIR